MKILLINALLVGGGTEVQTLREKANLENHGHEVWHITFSNGITSDLSSHHINIYYNRSSLFRIWYRFKLDRSFYQTLKQEIDKINPDIIRINNLQDNAYTVLEACKGYEVYKTIRDCGIVCSKGDCLKGGINLCSGFKNNDCVSCIGSRLNYQILNYQADRIRKQYISTVSQFLCPSQFLTNLSILNGFNTMCLNNPFDFSKVVKTSPTHGQVFMYYGIVSKNKGVLNLLEAFRAFNYKNRFSKLIIAGKLGDISEEQLLSYNDCGVSYVGLMSHDEIMKLYSNINFVVVPSIGLENYPNTVLEALACKTIVIGSYIGGIPELINDKRFIFDPFDINDIVEKLDKVVSLSEAEYDKVVFENYLRVCNNNSMENYYSKLMSIITKTNL